jgi:Zn ribbon nucleic-acid-binding protein
MAKKETLKQAGYTFVKYLGTDKTIFILKDEDGKLEVFANNPNHASWGIKDKINGKNVDLEFVRSFKESIELDEADELYGHKDKDGSGKCPKCGKKTKISSWMDTGKKCTSAECRKCGNVKAVKESNVDKVLTILEGGIPNSTFIRDALDKVITGDADLTDKERLALLKYKLIGDNGKPTKLAKEQFSELFD